MKELMGLLADNPLGEVIRGRDWTLPALQSLHILAIAALMSAVLLINLRAVGGLARDLAPTTLVANFRPWFRCSLAVLLGTGVLMIIAEPERTLTNPWFGLKLLLVIAGSFGFGRQSRLAAADLPLSRPLAIASLSGWLAVICCGRWIAYT